ncbi:Uncharacterized protein TCM_012672 [Theobroma cacao]|uniref:Transposase MuDR plant domain-containing protein n=1 Tax=Theobroma cacao TaxID=3641 RepID=A0A061FUS0_THECC|nr:Uncharacterized protein TCM_012672 [Theobroma cacao]
MQRVRSDLSFAGLMKLVEDVVGVNSEIDEIELHALISTPGELSWPIIKDDEDVALILLEQRNVPAVGSGKLMQEPCEVSVDISGVERFSFQPITTEESTCADDHLYKGRMFSSKAELKRALNMLVIKEKFAIRVKRSCKGCYEVGCKDKACKFSLRATKLLERGEYWQVRTFHKVHTCTVDGLQGRFPTTSAKIIGELISHKLRANGVALRPKNIICEMRVQWGLECLNGKAWQAKEYVERLVFDLSEESFQLLPSYFYMLEQENPNTLTAMATNEAERFKYCFWSYGTCIRGFRDVMRPTVAIDATHLKSRFKGVLFVATCKDENQCVYPVAFGIGIFLKCTSTFISTSTSAFCKDANMYFYIFLKCKLEAFDLFIKYVAFDLFNSSCVA